jgi:tRNA pseudouridine55 synthase
VSSGRKAKGRKIDGILLLDKPIGISSNRALQQVKRLYQASKAGHTGNLDPLATGMLPVCLGEATKVSAYLLDADKTYVATCKLGITTTTADSEGEILKQRSVEAYLPEDIEDVLDQFSGDILQTPPMYSALKQNGVALYKLAREGIEVERKSRKVTIHRLQVLEFSGDELKIEVHCSKGTYIRTLAEEIGERLGCGAHLIQLHRTSVGPFQQADMYLMPQLEQLLTEDFAALDELLLPVEAALQGWPVVSLSETGVYYIKQGQAVQVAQAPDMGLVRLQGPSSEFIGMGHILEDGRVAPKRLFHM